MRSYLATFLRLGVATAILAPATAAAQQVDSFDQLPRYVRPGETIFLTDTGGKSTKGKVESLSATSLRVITRGSVLEFEEKDVAEIAQRRKDPLSNGAKTGFFVGAGIGFVAAAVAQGAKDEAPLAGAVGGGIYGAILGLVIDALKKSRHTVYRAPGTTPRISVRVATFASRDQQGVVLTVSF